MATADGLVWHYTDTFGLHGILQSQYLRASNIADLNDLSEVKYGLKMFREVLSGNIGVRPNHPDIVNDARLALSNGGGSALVFVASASDGKDILNQWQHYGSRGFAIGLDARPSYDLIPGGGAVGRYTAISWTKVSYDENEQLELVNKAIERMNEVVSGMSGMYGRTRANLRGGAVFSPEEEASHRRLYVNECSSVMLAAAATLKDPVFYSEREWRVVFRATDETLQCHNHVGADAKLRQHVQVACASGQPACTSGLPIRAIRCGPTGGAPNEEMERNVRRLLDDAGFGDRDIDVSTSRLPYYARR